MMKVNNHCHKPTFLKTCHCSKCKMTTLAGKGQPDMHIYQSYLDFAKNCLVYQDLVQKKNIPKGESYLNQIVNFDRQKLDRRALDVVFEDFIKNYSRYVLKDTFDLGIKKSYYATHKKVQSILKERNIPQQKEDDTTVKLIEAYKLEKNKLFIQSKAKNFQNKPEKVKSLKVRKVKPRDSLTKSCKSQEYSYITEPTQVSEKVQIPKLAGLRENDARYSIKAPRTTNMLSLTKKESCEEQLPRLEYRNSFMALKRRNLWRSMYVSMMKKSDQKKQQKLR